MRSTVLLYVLQQTCSSLRLELLYVGTGEETRQLTIGCFGLKTYSFVDAYSFVSSINSVESVNYAKVES